jgi:hypothetical protein
MLALFSSSRHAATALGAVKLYVASNRVTGLPEASDLDKKM